MKPLCSNSGCDNPRDGSGRYCRKCHAAYMRTYRRDTHPLRNPHIDHIIEADTADDEFDHVARAVACLEAS